MDYRPPFLLKCTCISYHQSWVLSSSLSCSYFLTYLEETFKFNSMIVFQEKRAEANSEKKGGENPSWFNFFTIFLFLVRNLDTQCLVKNTHTQSPKTKDISSPKIRPWKLNTRENDICMSVYTFGTSMFYFVFFF